MVVSHPTILLARCIGSYLGGKPRSPGDSLQPVVEIRAFESDDLERIVAFSVQAWEPVFASVRAVLGEPIFRRLHPDWRSGQAETVRTSCTSGQLDVFVAVRDAHPVGFAGVALNAYHDRMGVIEIIAVDPAHQRTGIAAALTRHALNHMRQQGMDIAVVETGGDPGHAPARATYAATGFRPLPIARYFQLLADGHDGRDRSGVPGFSSEPPVAS
jgi:GNAT superfamily N-acetyltransferase